MSPSHHCAMAQNLAYFSQNFEIGMFKLENNDLIHFLNIFTHFMSMFRDFLAIFLRKVFKIKIVTAEPNPLLECLVCW